MRVFLKQLNWHKVSDVKSPLPPLAFIKKRGVPPFGKRQWLRGIYFFHIPKLIGLCLLLLSHLTFAEFAINDAKTHLINEVYVLNANLSYTLTETVVEALQNGISLPLILTIVIERDRWYLWDEKIATLKQRYQIKYYAFRKQYVIKYLNTGIQKTFDNLNTALTHLGQLEDFPLLDKHLIEGDERYWVYLHTYLDIESLPVPLRPIAYLSSPWRLNSNWFLCPLQP